MKQKQPQIGITQRLAVLACAGLGGLLFQAGCNLPALIGTPTSDETKIPAEYNLAPQKGQKGQKILVFVDVPSSLNAHPNLRFFLTDTINKTFQQKAKISPTLLIDYDTLAEFRASTSDFSLLSPEQVGSALGADLVLSVVVSDCKFAGVGDTSYLDISLDAQASLIKVSTGEKLWPSVESAKIIRVGFESEGRGADVAAVRLAAATAHCVTRYLYDCPKKQFKIKEEKTDIGW
jgi:hypothetical protein